MLRIDLGRAPRNCDGISRRSFLQVGVAGLAALGLPQLLLAGTAGTPRKTPPSSSSGWTAARATWTSTT